MKRSMVAALIALGLFGALDASAKEKSLCKNSSAEVKNSDGTEYTGGSSYICVHTETYYKEKPSCEKGYSLSSDGQFCQKAPSMDKVQGCPVGFEKGPEKIAAKAKSGKGDGTRSYYCETKY